MKQTNIQKAWIGGTNTIVVTVPKKIVEMQNIEVGDYLEITIEKIENETTKFIKKEKEKLKENNNKLIIQE